MGKGRCRLGLNCVGGDSATRVSKQLGKHGVMITYGAMSKKPVTASNGAMTFKNISFKGFHMDYWFALAKPDVSSMMAEIFQMIDEGKLVQTVDSVYPLDKSKDAFKKATESGRNGKVLLKLSD